MRRLLVVFAALALVLADAGAAAALTKTSATWTQMNAGPALFWQGTAFAGSTCRLVSFGGTTGSQTFNSTSLFDPVANTWTTIAGMRTGPSARQFAQMAWNPVTQRVVMFGGRGTGSRPGTAWLQDTWSFSPATKTWTPLITSCKTGTCPPGRSEGGLVWSSKINRLVLFGGTARFPETMFDDVWTFNGTWTKATVSGPKPTGRMLFGMAEDATTGKIVVYGGVTGPGLTPVNDTWLLDPTTMTWSKVAASATPPSYGETAMAWSPSIGAVVLTGGSDWQGSTVTNPGTWAFDATARTWIKLTTYTTPSPRKNAALVTDTCQGAAILFAGEDGPIPPTFSDRTWVLR